MLKTVGQYKEDVLKWFLGFINVDIGELSHGERLMHIADALYIIESGSRIYIHAPEWIKEAISKKTHQWEAEGKLVEYHTLLKGIFEKIMDNIRKNSDLGKKWVPEGEIIPRETLASFEINTKTTFQLAQEGRFESKVINKNKKGEQKLYRLKQDEFNRITFTIAEQDKRSEEIRLLYAFYSALSGIQTGSLKTCKECGNYFLHTTKMKRKFCTNKCAARKGSRDQREKLKKDKKKYDAYKKKGRERARKSYDKSTPPGSKVTRRPYKHKDSTKK